MESSPQKTYVIATRPIEGLPTALQGAVFWPVMSLLLATCFVLDYSRQGEFLPLLLGGLLFGGVMSAMLIGVIVVLFRLAPLGTWTINEEGVHFVHSYGYQTFIQWEEVERIRWGFDSMTISAGRRRIRVIWKIAKPEEREPARAFVESILKPDFDLTIPESDNRPSLRRMLSMLAVGTVTLLPAAGLLYWAAANVRDEQQYLWAARGFCVAMVIALVVPFVIGAARASRWSVRQSESNGK